MKISCLKQRLRTLQENLKSTFKPMIEKESVNNQKVQKLCQYLMKTRVWKMLQTFLQIFGRQNIQNQNNTKHFNNHEDIFNRHMHKMGSWGSNYYIFGDHFWSKNARKLRFYLILHFTGRKHMILSFYLKWTEFTRNCEVVPI